VKAEGQKAIREKNMGKDLDQQGAFRKEMGGGLSKKWSKRRNSPSRPTRGCNVCI
jgi:hypothetical protein